LRNCVDKTSKKYINDLFLSCQSHSLEDRNTAPRTFHEIGLVDGESTGWIRKGGDVVRAFSPTNSNQALEMPLQVVWGGM